MREGPDGMVYYADIVNQSIKRIRSIGARELSASPASLDYGTVAGSQVRNVVVENTAASTITIDDLTLSGSSDFALVQGDPPIVLASGATTTLTVRFTPSGDGASSATLGIVHDGTNSPINVPLSGTGVNQPPTVSIIQPVEGQIERIGSQVALAADASDPDGSVTVTWEGTLHHGEDHIHPGEFQVSGTTGSFEPHRPR